MVRTRTGVSSSSAPPLPPRVRKAVIAHDPHSSVPEQNHPTTLISSSSHATASFPAEVPVPSQDLMDVPVPSFPTWTKKSMPFTGGSSSVAKSKESPGVASSSAQNLASLIKKKKKSVPKSRKKVVRNSSKKSVPPVGLVTHEDVPSVQPKENFAQISRPKRKASESVLVQSASQKTKSIASCSSSSGSSDLSPEFVAASAHSMKFFSAVCAKLWKIVSKRKLLPERLIDADSFAKIGIVDLLKSRGLFGTVSKVKPFVSSVVHEFYSNLDTRITDKKAPQFHKVYVRGHIFNFSPALISEFYGCQIVASEREWELDLQLDMGEVVSELTGGAIVDWSTLNSFLSATLSVRYSALHKIALVNWLPSLHVPSVSKDLAILLYCIGTGKEFDMGKHIFETIVSFAGSDSSYGTLPFPSLIYEILRSQKDVRSAAETLDYPKRPLKVSQKLFHGRHVYDIQGEPSLAFDIPSSSRQQGFFVFSQLFSRSYHSVLDQ